MGLFSKPEIIILKESNDAQTYLDKLKSLQQLASGDLQNQIQKEIALTQAGIIGEENILFELKHSNMDMIVLHDIYIETHYALSRGIIIADTKFEFGLDENGNVVLGDEMLTPDSSRFWPLEGYEPGHSQPSFDKQFVRDWLKANPDSNYDLPQDVIDKTIAKYLEAYELLTGKKL